MLPPAGVFPNCTSLDSEELLQFFRQGHSYTDLPARGHLTELKCKNYFLSAPVQQQKPGLRRLQSEMLLCFRTSHHKSVIFVSSVFSYSFHVANVDKEEVRLRH